MFQLSNITSNTPNSSENWTIVKVAMTMRLEATQMCGLISSLKSLAQSIWIL